MRERILHLLKVLEAIYFLAKARDANLERLDFLRDNVHKLDRDEETRLLAELEEEVGLARAHYGAIATNGRFLEMLEEARAAPGYVYLMKIVIDREFFGRYEQTFSRWLHVPLHALVVFDAKVNHDVRQILTPEGAFYRDAFFHISQAREITKKEPDLRKRKLEDQLALLSYSRAAVTAVFSFLEAYLNGIAYDCFMQKHDELALDDHDLLGEWNSRKKRRRFVQFETKLFAYPRVVAQAYGLTLDVSGLEAPTFLAEESKKVRDALVHPSTYVDPISRQPEKLFFITGAGLEAAEQIFTAAREYVLAVEKGIGKDLKESMPWIFEWTI